MRLFGIAALASVLLAPPVHAQSSASYKLTEFALNAGGGPATSTSYHVSLEAIGDTVAGVEPASASYHGDTGFASGYPPPGEVVSLLFADTTTLTWSPERSVGSYDVYRDVLSTLPGGFGTCFASGSSSEAAADPGVPAAGQGWFYLVTARNRLGEEGTKGFDTSGSERANGAPCP